MSSYERRTGPIKLGATVSEVAAVLGPPGKRRFDDEMHYFDDSFVQATFDTGGRLNFVGAAKDTTLDVRYRDVPVFKVDADDLAQFIGCDASPLEDPHTRQFHGSVRTSVRAHIRHRGMTTPSRKG